MLNYVAAAFSRCTRKCTGIKGPMGQDLEFRYTQLEMAVSILISVIK